MNGTKLYTVGYAGRKLDDFVLLVQAAGVQVVLDVRELPLSRVRGFSKTPLRDALLKAQIDYVHLRDAGNPYRHLAHDIERCLMMYRRHLASRPDILARVKDAVAGRRAALLCVETDPACCHRSVLAQQLHLPARDL